MNRFPWRQRGPGGGPPSSASQGRARGAGPWSRPLARARIGAGLSRLGEKGRGGWEQAAAGEAGRSAEGVLPGEILRQVRRLEIRTRAVVSEVFAGQYHSAFKGRGVEFAEVREYVPGDDTRTIDWNVTARYGAPFVKKYVEERELTIFLAVDASASQSFGSAGRSKVELAAEVAALIAFSAINNQDKVGLLTFTDRPETFIPPRKGRPHGLRLIREILYGRPAGSGTDLGAACERIVLALKRRSVVFLLSDFLAPASSFAGPLGTLARQHDLIALQIRDPLEEPRGPARQPGGEGPARRPEEKGAGVRGWPDLGLIEWEDPESGRRVLIDTSDRAALARVERAAAEAREKVAALLSRHRIDAVTLRVGSDPVEPLHAFFRLRARRLARE